MTLESKLQALVAEWRARVARYVESQKPHSKSNFLDGKKEAFSRCAHDLEALLAERQEPPTLTAREGVATQMADDILLRIAKRYANCEVNIYPDCPELTPVEAVLRCAREEGFHLTNAAQPSSGTGEKK